MGLLLSPSIMCADFKELGSEVTELDHAGADMFHMDVMDGQYVPNFGLSPQDFATVRSLTKKLVDAHLMIENPRQYLKFFSDLGVDLIYFAPTAEKQPARAIDEIHALGKKAGIEVNTGTSFETVKELLPNVDYVLIMTVHPGFSGQPFQESVIPKLKQFVRCKDTYDYIVGIDGAVSRDRIKELHAIGVDNFVLGTSSLFGKTMNYEQTITEIRKEND